MIKFNILSNTLSQRVKYTIKKVTHLRKFESKILNWKNLRISKYIIVKLANIIVVSTNNHSRLNISYNYVCIFPLFLFVAFLFSCMYTNTNWYDCIQFIYWYKFPCFMRMSICVIYVQLSDKYINTIYFSWFFVFSRLSLSSLFQFISPFSL